MRIRDSLHNDHLPDTYYKHTCNDLEPFRRLEGSERVQVCIVGGGFTGVSAAVELAERGIDVALVEQNQIGWGASGRSGGQILTGSTDFSRYQASFGEDNAPLVWAMSTEGAQIIRKRVAKYKIDCDLLWGGVEIARTSSENTSLQAKVASLQLHNSATELKYLDKSEVRRFVASSHISTGLFRGDWGRCHPLNLCRGEARAAESLGAKIYEDARVSDIGFGEKVVVDTGHGKVIADTVILAGNAYLGALVPSLADKYIMASEYMMVTEPLQTEWVSKHIPQNFAFREQSEAPRYFHLTAENRLLFGVLNPYPGKHPRNMPKHLTRKLYSIFPNLKGVKCERTWGGLIAVGEKRIPQVGQLTDNVFFAQAFSGRGVADAHLSGRVIAEKITHENSRFDVFAEVQHSSHKWNGAWGRFLKAAEKMPSFLKRL